MLKLKRFKEGVWYDVPGLPGVRVKVRPVPMAVAMELQNKVRKKVAVRVPDDAIPDRVEIVDDMDPTAFSWLLFDHALEAWEGIEMEIGDGEPEPTEEDVRRAIFDSDIRPFISEKARELLDQTLGQLEKERKNSKSSQSG